MASDEVVSEAGYMFFLQRRGFGEVGVDFEEIR